MSINAAHLVSLNYAVVPDLMIITTLTIIDTVSCVSSLFFLDSLQLLLLRP